MQQLEPATVTTADLGPRVAAVTAKIRGRPAAVINIRAAHDPDMCSQAAYALAEAGIEAARLSEVLDGIRS
jgi:hypothetical protein